MAKRRFFLMLVFTLLLLLATLLLKFLLLARQNSDAGREGYKGARLVQENMEEYAWRGKGTRCV